MVRRGKIKRNKQGIPEAASRCEMLVYDPDELFSRRCRKARLRGSAFCEIHKRKQQ